MERDLRAPDTASRQAELTAVKRVDESLAVHLEGSSRNVSILSKVNANLALRVSFLIRQEHLHQVRLKKERPATGRQTVLRLQVFARGGP